MNTSHLCIAGGGTGGHVMPALALADAAREKWIGLHVSFIGAERGLEAKLLPKRGEDVLLLSMHAVQGKNIFSKLRVLLWEVPCAVQRIRKHWKQHKRPSVLVGVGGYASATGVLAAIVSRIPVVLYEQNAVPGLVNRTLARFAKCMMLGFAEAEKHITNTSTAHTGNIVRSDIAAVTWQAHTPPCLLVLGGSQGARFLNETVPQACACLKERAHTFTVIHICGGDDTQQTSVQQRYQHANIHAEVIRFCADMPSFYARGNVLIARSGAMTVSEASMVGLPSIFVPLPHAADQHQTYNAQSLSHHGAAITLQQSDISIETLTDILEATLFDSEKQNKMHQQLLSLRVCDAKERQLHVLSPWLQGEVS
jgi:UDP-N-acetylglucosamine--N-acetylmuramyl-(pentapeptide) pyrophosphoryl-undecaprenol N-acetylglucosamine transferase